MKLPRWLRHLGAKISVLLEPYEWGGVLYDYANGRIIELHRWETDKELQIAESITENMLTRGQDAIYFVVVKVGPGMGYFAAYTSRGDLWVRYFRIGMYQPAEAFVDMIQHLKKQAKEMGFSKETENNCA